MRRTVPQIEPQPWFANAVIERPSCMAKASSESQLGLNRRGWRNRVWKVSDFHRVGDVRWVLHIDGNDDFSPRKSGLGEMGTQLKQEQSRWL